MGGVIVAGLGAQRGLIVDLLTFLLSAVVVALVVPERGVKGTPASGIAGFFHDLGVGATYIGRHGVLRRLLVLTSVASLAIAAPEAAGIPYAGDAGLGGVLMAAPIAGAAVGVVVVTRWQPEVANGRLIAMALALPVPLLFTAFQPTTAITVGLWFVSGMFQAFMVPLQATFSLVTPEVRRGTAFALASAVATASMAVAYLLAGWLSQLTNPAAAVAMCAVLCLGATVLLAARWPHAAVRQAVEVAYSSDDEPARG